MSREGSKSKELREEEEALATPYITKGAGSMAEHDRKIREGQLSLISYLICIFINFNHQFNSYLKVFSISKEGPWPSLACM
jgi:hypothetical protein